LHFLDYRKAQYVYCLNLALEFPNDINFSQQQPICKQILSEAGNMAVNVTCMQTSNVGFLSLNFRTAVMFIVE